MIMIPDETVDQVRESADLVGLIGEAVELKRTGSDYRGPCPFHGGTHRNFAVIPKKNRYYCFVCHESGDVFSWLMKRFGMDYPTAVREAARRVGIVIPEGPARAGPDPREPLFEAVAVAQDWFTRQLIESPEGATAREYLAGREISLEIAGQHGLGFAPQGRAFLSAMRELGLEEKVLLEAGLSAARDDGKVIPRFRARLLFPIHDLRGRVAGFGGRLLVPGEPKYLNSPETPIFHKGKQLYNLHQAKSAIRKAESVILVEGYFDVFRLVLAGLEHVVAPLGTSLTAEQAGLLRRSRLRPPCSTTATPPASEPPSVPATSCCATGSGCGSRRCRPARIPTRWCGRAARRCCSRFWTTASTCWSGRSSSWSSRGGSRAWSTSARLSTGCCRPSARRRIPSPATSISTPSPSAPA